LLTWLGLPLGFGKAVQGRINNHYPQEWRIRHL
jgi:NOL1/NOP2/fmu family ribosome biogenesis protein